MKRTALKERKFSANQLTAELNQLLKLEGVSVKTVRRILNKDGIMGRAAATKLYVSPETCAISKAWCREKLQM